MKTFKNIASLVKIKRISHPEAYSQEELAKLLGLKTHSLIAKIEEADCGVPLKSAPRLSEILNIHPNDFKEAVLKDHQESLERFFNNKVLGKPKYV
jgi:transcriptional regulator with XRE-family HTH domain